VAADKRDDGAGRPKLTIVRAKLVGRLDELARTVDTDEWLGDTEAQARTVLFLINNADTLPGPKVTQLRDHITQRLGIPPRAHGSQHQAGQDRGDTPCPRVQSAEPQTT